MKKFIKKTLVLLIAFVVMIFLHKSCSSTHLPAEESASLKETVIDSYKAFSLSSFEAAKNKTMQYAEELYQNDVAEGKTDKEFKGTNVIGYFWKALDEYKEEFNVTESPALFLPLILAILAIIAVIVSIRLGLSAIRKLDFDNDATSF